MTFSEISIDGAIQKVDLKFCRRKTTSLQNFNAFYITYK